LPSIHEALGPPASLPYPPSSVPAPISTTQPAPTSPRNHSSGPSPTVAIPRSHPSDGPHLDSNGSNLTRTPYLSHTQPQLSTSSYQAPLPPPTEARRASGPLPYGSDRLPSLHGVGSPEQRPRVDRHAPPYEHTSPQSTHHSTHPLTTNASPAYSHQASRYPYPPAPSNGVHPLSQPPSHYSSHTGPYPSRYESHPDAGRAAEGPSDGYKGFKSVNGERYGTSVKRHLDYFDLENSLNEVCRPRSKFIHPETNWSFSQLVDSSSRLREFGRDFKDRARELPRAGPAPGLLPSINEVDSMINHQSRVQELLLRLRDMLVSQQNAMASQQGPEPRYKGHGDYDIDNGVIYEDGKSEAFMGPDAKKRRGRAAPPGRCHSCNRAETPEWRRGPDGARTLCNACGLRKSMPTPRIHLPHPLTVPP
jgi:glutamate--cysteine ligase catalytic subunit